MKTYVLAAIAVALLAVQPGMAGAEDVSKQECRILVKKLKACSEEKSLEQCKKDMNDKAMQCYRLFIRPAVEQTPSVEAKRVPPVLPRVGANENSCEFCDNYQYKICKKFGLEFLKGCSKIIRKCRVGCL